MQCLTTISLEDGSKTTRPKKTYNTLDEAIEMAKKENVKQAEKLVAYKCRDCHKYHIGRNGKIVTSKERQKLIQQYPPAQIKVVGYFDLTTLKK